MRQLYISEPRNVRLQQSGLTSVTLCWSRPMFGDVTGYVVRYRNLNNTDLPIGGAELRNTANEVCPTISSLQAWTR